MEGLVGIMIPAQFQGKLFSESNVRIFLAEIVPGIIFPTIFNMGTFSLGAQSGDTRRLQNFDILPRPRLRYSWKPTMAKFKANQTGDIHGRPGWRHAWALIAR